MVELLVRVVAHEPIYRRWFQPVTRFFAPVPDPTNPWTDTKVPPPDLDPAVYRAMAAGELNPWLKEHLRTLPGMISYDYTHGLTPELYLQRIAQVCRESGADLLVAYIPFSGTVHHRYAPALVALGMDRATAESLSTDSRYGRQAELLARWCPGLGIPLADTTQALKVAEREEGPQFWNYDTHPRPAGYATIAKRIHQVWRLLHDDQPVKNARGPESVNESS